MTAFANQITHVVAGNSATTQATFMVPDIFTALSSGYIVYDLIDADNAVYSSGTGINYTVTASNEANSVTADCSITVPSNIPVTAVGTNYQVRYTLILPDEEDQEFYIYTTLVILPPQQVELGASDAVELAGSSATLLLTIADPANALPVVDLYFQNTPVTGVIGIPATGPTNLADGYQYQAVLSTSTIPAQLVPFTAIWSYAVGAQSFKQNASVFLVTPSLMQAMKEMLTIVNKSRAHFGYQPVFNEHEIMNFLKMGADLFNGTFNPTMFTMTNATGPVRHFWIQCSSIIALRSQYLMEGESTFNFSGQSISLDVDRAQFYESLASTIEQSIQEPMRQLKANLAKRGLISGDGNVNPLGLGYNAVGTIGVTASPVSNMRASNLTGWLMGPRGFM